MQKITKQMLKSQHKVKSQNEGENHKTWFCYLDILSIKGTF